MAPQNFGRDFCDGTVLLGLVHSLRPDLFNWSALPKDSADDNIRNALQMAEQHMGIPALLDAQQLLGGNPDEKSVMTYVVNFLMYEQENRDMLETVARGVAGEEARQREEAERARQAKALADAQRRLAEAQEAERRQLEEQKRIAAQLAEQRRQMEELDRQRQLLQQQRQLAEQQKQLAMMEEQKRQLQAMQQQKMLEQQKQLAELQRQREEYARQQQLQQQLLLQRQQQEELARQQAMLAQQQAAAQQLQMAAEVARMKFFQQLQQQATEGIGKRDYVLFIDKSGSMAGSRWQEARKAVESLAPQVTRASPQGTSLYFFNDECTRIDNVTTADQVREFFQRQKPDRGTNLSLALMHAFDVHFKTKRGKPETWLIVTDGAPDRPTHVWEVLKENHAKVSVWRQVILS